MRLGWQLRDSLTENSPTVQALLAARVSGDDSGWRAD